MGLQFAPVESDSSFAKHLAEPYGNSWSTPFAKWQGSIAHRNSLRLAANTGKQARVDKGQMPMAVAPASMTALKKAGLKIKDVDAVKTHNPFAVNDIAFARKTGFPPEKMNNYDCSLIWGQVR